MNQQILDRGVELKSQRLSKKQIALAACGGIAATELVKIIRELRRHGAEVTPFLTPSVEDFISAMSIEWAANRPVIVEPTVEVDHLDPFDAVVVAPATLNTIAKAAVGISDNSVTLLIASQLGRRGPLLFVPTMNLALREHPAYDEHVKRLEKWGATFFASEAEEDRLKMPPPEKFVDAVVALVKKKSK